MLDQGVAAKLIEPAGPGSATSSPRSRPSRKATEADLAEAAKTAPAATALIRIGDRYYGLGNYAKAAELYRAALAKPGADANVANLHLGMALARAGDKAGAAAAFNTVDGSRAEIAKYWLLYLTQSLIDVMPRRRRCRHRFLAGRLSRFGMVKRCRLSATLTRPHRATVQCVWRKRIAGAVRRSPAHCVEPARRRPP